MNVSTIALDYDGTISADNGLDPEVREAIAAARTAGYCVLLVTGRILGELRRVLGDLHVVDGVVAENGAVLHFPDSGQTRLLAPPVPAALAEALRARGVSFQSGQCLIDAAADEAPRILDAIRAVEAPAVLVFNRSRVMTMPQGVSKATGLHTALDTMRLSPRNTIAIGDAENDHELLRYAEIGAAVEWGCRGLQRMADLVIRGQGPPAVARYLRELIASGRMPTAPARRRLHLGYTEDGAEFTLAVRGRNVLIAGDARSGKSWVAGLLCEQLILHGYCVCVLDPEGDYRSLEALPGVTLLGGDDDPPTPRELLRALRYPDRSVVIDLARLPHDRKIEYIRAALPALNAMRRRSGLPHRIVVDEAHYFLHDAAARHLLDFDYNGYTVVTYCASRLPPELMKATEVMIVTCESNPAEVEALRERCATCQRVDPTAWRLMSRLALGQAVALPVTEEAGGELRLFTIGTRLTPHVRHRQKYVDVPVTDSRAFFFAANGHPAVRAHTLREFVAVIEHTDIREADGYLRRGDFSRWIGDVFGDRALAHDLQTQERRYVSGEDRDTLPEIADAVRARYDLTEEV